MDAFYASVEMRDNPELRGKPVIVGGLGGRGVVAAASYEVRKYGVHSAMPVREALKRCPHAVCVKPRFERYKAVSTTVFEIFHRFTPLVQGLSLDEAFLDVTASLALKGDAVSIARAIKNRITAMTQLTASVGVARLHGDTTAGPDSARVTRSAPGGPSDTRCRAVRGRSCTSPDRNRTSSSPAGTCP